MVKNIRLLQIIARVARDILSISTSTVTSKSTFSTGGVVIYCYKNRMTMDTMKALICTQ